VSTENQNIKIEVKPEGDTLTILTGEVLTPKEKQSVTLKGTIGSVLDFAEKRKHVLAEIKDLVHTIFNREALTLELVAHENEAVKYKVQGELKLTGEVLSLGINKGTGYSAKQLASVLKLKRWLFRSQEEQVQLLNSLTKVETAVSLKFNEADDFRGNKAHQKTQEITTSIPLSFVLVAPIAEGEAPEHFTIDIELDVVNGNEIKLFLVSPALEQRKQEYITKVFADAKQVFDAAGFVVIQQ